MKVLPIKLPDEMYNDLKLLSQATNISMADFIRREIKKPLKVKIKTIKKKETKNQDPQDFLKYMLQNPISGKDHMPGLTHDEILYGYTYNKKGEKIWPKKSKKS